MIFLSLINKIVSNLKINKKASPLVEESILLGLSLFAFMILASIIFDLVDFAKQIFTTVSDGLNQFP